MTDEEIRDALEVLSVAEVAREAKVRPTTLYSFLSGATRKMRSDTKDQTVAAIRRLRGIPEVDSAEIVDLWSRKLDERGRKEVLDFARWKAGNTD